MSELENNIVTWLTGKPTLADVSVSQLENIVSQYPYFTIAQLLLTAKLKEENHPGYDRQLQKTALNFQDPKWLFFQLNQLTDYKKEDKDLSKLSGIEDVDASVNLEIAETIIEKDTVALDTPNITEKNIPEKDIQAEKEKVKAFLKSVIDNPNVQLEEKSSENILEEKEEIIAPTEAIEHISSDNPIDETFSESVDEYIAAKDQPKDEIPSEFDTNEDVILDNAEESPVAEPIESEENTVPSSISEENTLSENVDDSVVEADRLMSESTEEVENSVSEEQLIAENEIFAENKDEYIGEIDQPKEEIITEVFEEQLPNITHEILEESEVVIEPSIENISENNIAIEEEQEDLAEISTPNLEDDNDVDNTEIDTESLSKETNTSENEEENLIGEKMSAKLANIASSFKSEAIPQQPLISEEATPAHVKDYFASIGVKVNNTIQTDFGQKVKKFTEWLKVMKKIGPDGQLIQTSEKEEQLVAQDAAKSNQNSDIVTEAMVDVLTKQGKKNEAIEILNRLSLLKPEKSAYFASQINDLNENK